MKILAVMGLAGAGGGTDDVVVPGPNHTSMSNLVYTTFNN